MNNLFPQLPYRRNAASQSEHNRMIETLANRLEERGLYVLADHINWHKGTPQKLDHHIPDLIYWDQGQQVIVEVETLDSCDSVHAISQFRAFSKAGPTVVVIPPEPLLPGFKKSHLENLIRQNKLSNVQVAIFEP